MRLFCAINIISGLRDEICCLQAKLKMSGADVKWVEPDNLHFTIKFFGEVTDDRIELIDTIVAPVCTQFDKFEMRIEKIGVFPDLRNPRVIWSGVNQGAEQLKLLAEKIDTGLSAIGFDKEKRPFSAHLTLGRTISNRGIDQLVHIIQEAKEHKFGEQEVKQVDLMQSVLQPNGPVYKVVRSWSLK